MVQMQPDAACTRALVGLMAHAIAEGISAGMTKALSVLDATFNWHRPCRHAFGRCLHAGSSREHPSRSTCRHMQWSGRVTATC